MPEKTGSFRALLKDARYRPLTIASIAMAGIFAIGVTGYLFIGYPRHTFIDALYMTVITLTTVGYGETIDLSDSPGGRLFTIGLLLSGVGTFLYFFSALTGFIVEGTLERVVWRRKMMRMIDRLRGHYVVCGGGHTGEHILRELIATSRPFVLIEMNEDRVRFLHDHFGTEFPAIVGDATTDEMLTGAGVEHASGLFAALSNDKDNLIITISARLLQPKLRIVSSSNDDAVERKIRRAGADVVVSANMIGGLRMTSEMIRPHVVSFLDVMLRDREKRLRFEESTVQRFSVLDGASTGDLRKRGPQEMLLVALCNPDGTWTYNPADDVRLVADTTLIYLGSPEVRVGVERLTSAALG